MSDRAMFVCNGKPVDVEIAPGESLLSVLRERLGVVSAKDGCAPQGQCGCCTVLVDGEPRVACVTPAGRVHARSVTTVEGLDSTVRDRLATAFATTGGSQCGFCTPGIVMRAAALLQKGRTDRAQLDRALAAHLCRCTGWLTVYEAIAAAAAASAAGTPRTDRRLNAASRRAELEGGVAQRVGPDIALGGGGFADDEAPRNARVAVPLPPGSTAPAIEAAGTSWVVAESLQEARALAAKVQGRRTTIDACPPLPLPERPAGGVRLATSWVEPAYLEPDASWCAPGGEPATPLANGGAFGGKESSIAPMAARELAGALGRPVRVLFSREDVVRLGPKRSPIAASAVLDGQSVRVRGNVAAGPGAEVFLAPVAVEWPYALDLDAHWTPTTAAGPPTTSSARAAGVAEHTLLLEGAVDEAGVDRTELVTDERVARVLLDVCAPTPSGALAGAHIDVDANGTVAQITVRVAAGDPLDEVVLRSYAIGAAHMALGWVTAEELAVDGVGEVHDLTIRSFGVLRARDTPPIEIEIVDDPGPPLARASDAVFAAVATATWNAISRSRGERPDSFPVH